VWGSNHYQPRVVGVAKLQYGSGRNLGASRRLRI
jgi:hypothetical protein